MPVDTHFNSIYTVCKIQTFECKINNGKINFSKLFSYMF